MLFAKRYLKEINGILIRLDDTWEKRQGRSGYLTRAEFQVLSLRHKLDHFLGCSLLEFFTFYYRYGWMSK
jgi:hypothetical protein